MKKKIIISVSDFSHDQLKAISESVSKWADLEILTENTEEKVYKNVFSDCEIFVGWPDAGLIGQSNIRLLQTGSSGWENYQGKGLEKKQGFSLCTARGIYSIGVAEHAIAMMFGLVRRIPVYVHDKDRHKFQRHTPYSPEITGTIACIIGLGAIGSEISKRCKAVGMDVIAVVRDKSSIKPFFVDKIFFTNQLHFALGLADHIFLSLPGTPENQDFFNENAFASCKQNAFIYNVSRGCVINEDTLYDYIISGKIAGAGLDVTREEPLPKKSKLWKLGDNVLITGHSAGLSNGHIERFQKLVIDNLYRYFNSKPLLNKVI